MNRRVQNAVGIVIVVLALLLPQAPRISAQATVTLDTLATRIETLTNRIANVEFRLGKQGTRLHRLESQIEDLERKLNTPTPTPRPTPTRTPRPTRRPRQTATPQPCGMENIPEPPNRSLDCETWKVTYGLITLEVGYVPSSMHQQLAREVYPLIEKAASACRVSPTRLADYIVVASRRMDEMGKPSDMVGQSISYLIGATSADGFRDIVQSSGGCAEAITLIVVTAK